MRKLVNTITVTTAYTEIAPTFDIEYWSIYSTNGAITVQVYDENGWGAELSGASGVVLQGLSDCLKIKIKAVTGSVILNYTIIGRFTFRSQAVSSIDANYVETSVAYTLTDTDYQINCTANSFTISLPTAVSIEGKIYSIKNTGSGTITVDAYSAETIDGEITQELNQWDNLLILSDGTNWIII